VEAGMKFVFLCIAMVVWSGFQQNPQKAADEKAVPAEAKPAAEVVKLVNPTKPTAVSLAAGKKAYGLDCAMCHGKSGAGDGDLAADMKLTLKDYRDPDALKAMTDGEIYTVIDKGKGQMSGEEGRMKPAQIWDVVNYIRSLAKK
jgi:mono/diheme cytochrome c family protein